jgi:hypothetical protein
MVVSLIRLSRVVPTVGMIVPNRSGQLPAVRQDIQAIQPKTGFFSQIALPPDSAPAGGSAFFGIPPNLLEVSRDGR